MIINCGRDDEDVTKQTEGESNNNIANDTIEKPADEKSSNDTVISTLEALTAACGEKILNPDFLLQGGKFQLKIVLQNNVCRFSSSVVLKFTVLLLNSVIRSK